MRSSILAGLLAAGTAHAFSDFSPFLLFSTAEFSSQTLPTEQLQSSSRVLSSAKDILSHCPTTKYLLVSHPNVHATDLNGPGICRAHRLQAAVADSNVHGRFAVSEVANGAGVSNNMSFSYFHEHIKQSCLDKNGQEADVQELSLAPLPSATHCNARAEAMDDNDYVLGIRLQEELPKADLTVVYFSPAREGKLYKADFESPAQVQLKNLLRRSTGVTLERQASTHGGNGTAPLFEQYQFFTPGIFMGLVALSVILSIAYVGISALASLEVSYGAFDKELGPATHKKQA